MAFILNRPVKVLPGVRINPATPAARPAARKGTGGRTRPTRAVGAAKGKGRQSAGRASWTLRLGPWSYSSRTGRHTLKLTKAITWQSSTRQGRAAAKGQRRQTRAQERQHWEAYWGEKVYGQNTAPAGSAAPATSARTAKKRPAKNAAARTASAVVAPTAPAAGAGICGRRTADGSACQRLGKCPPGTHRKGIKPSKTSTATKTGTATKTAGASRAARTGTGNARRRTR